MAEKADLQEKARSLGLDDAGTVPELKARIAEHETAAEAPPAAVDAPPAADALEPDPEAARAVYDEQLARIAKREADEVAAKRAATAEAAARDLKATLRTQRDERAEAASSVATGKDAELAAKEASVPGSDPRTSVFDVAPGKSLEDVIARNEELAAGYHTDAPAEPKPAQHFIVTDEADLLEVARKLGLHDHAELGALNGRYSSNYGVQRGERVILPSQYTFAGIDGVVTEGEEDDALAGAEATA